MLAQLQALGVEISIDDFGTGHSSLAYIGRLPVNELKIDKTFVLGMRQRRSDRVIVESTVDLGRRLGLRVVAEGVEDQWTWDELARMGCDVSQGFYPTRPLPAEEFIAWLTKPGVGRPATIDRSRSGRHHRRNRRRRERSDEAVGRRRPRRRVDHRHSVVVVGLAGFEPATPGSQSQCASQTALQPVVATVLPGSISSRRGPTRPHRSRRNGRTRP